jgi:ribosomal protein S18 acetylase RimI-like enzyme
VDESQADQIAALLNKQNMLAETVTPDAILKHKDTIFFHAVGDKVIGSVKVVNVQWYQAEIKYLTVHLDYRHKGWGRRLLAEAEAYALRDGALVVQCTVRDDNLPSVNLFLSSGYKDTVMFTNPGSGNKVRVFQKVIRK